MKVNVAFFVFGMLLAGCEIQTESSPTDTGRDTGSTALTCIAGESTCIQGQVYVCQHGEFGPWDNCLSQGLGCTMIQGAAICGPVANNDTNTVDGAGSDSQTVQPDSDTHSNIDSNSSIGTGADDTDTIADTAVPRDTGLDTAVVADTANETDTTADNDTDSDVPADTDTDTTAKTDSDTTSATDTVVDTTAETDTGTNVPDDTGSDIDTATETDAVTDSDTNDATCPNDDNLAIHGDWVGCDPATRDDDPWGVQGRWNVVSDSGGTCSLTAPICDESGCRFYGTTTTGGTPATNWGCSMSIPLNTEIDGSLSPYSGPAECFAISLTGTSAGAGVSVVLVSTEEGINISPELFIGSLRDDWSGDVCFDTVECPDWVTSCDTPGEAFYVDIKVASGGNVGDFDITLTEFIPKLMPN